MLQIILIDSVRPSQVAAMVEHFAIVLERRPVMPRRVFQDVSGLDDGPIRDADRTHFAKAGNCCGQTQSEMDGFKQRVITSSQHSRVKLHDGRAPQILETVVFFEIMDSFRDVNKRFLKGARPFPGFRRVFREVLKNGPQIQKSAPIDVAEIAQQKMLFGRIQKIVIA